MSLKVILPADINRVDETGYVWAFLDEASDPTAVYPGAVVVAGDDDPVMAEVIDIVDKAGTQVVHLDVLGLAENFVAAITAATEQP